MGTELVTNGTFASDSGWAKGTGWSIAAGVASCDGSQVATSSLQQTLSTSLVANQTYKLSYLVTRSAGLVQIRVGDDYGAVIGSGATYTEYIKCDETVPLINHIISVGADADFVGTVDNASLQLSFALTPTWVEPMEPGFHNIVTPSESMKKQRQNVGATGVETFSIIFEGMSDADYYVLLNHYKLVKGDYDSFQWISVPSYIDTDMDGAGDGTNLTGYWVKGSFKAKNRAHGWDAEIVFEKVI